MSYIELDMDRYLGTVGEIDGVLHVTDLYKLVEDLDVSILCKNPPQKEFNSLTFVANDAQALMDLIDRYEPVPEKRYDLYCAIVWS